MPSPPEKLPEKEQCLPAGLYNSVSFNRQHGLSVLVILLLAVLYESIRLAKPGSTRP